MEKPTKKESTLLLLVIALIIFAYLCRFHLFPVIGGTGEIRTIIYTVLYTGWGISLYLRLIHPRVRSYSISIAVLMVVWIVVRQIKYGLDGGAVLLERYLWYLYYLPMLFIPLFAMLVALSIGLPESEKPSKKIRSFAIPTMVLFALVMTNDLHQLVFDFKGNFSTWSDQNMTYGYGYYVVAADILICAVGILVTLIRKCHRPKGRSVLLPCIPPFLLLVYAIFYYLGVPFVGKYLGDLPITFCVLYASTFELCIQCGLIRSNTGYNDLLKACSLGVQILDERKEVCISSAAPAVAEEFVICNSKDIRFGKVLWQEDVSELVEAIEQSEENYRELKERNRIHQENLDTEKEILTLQEKNRINDLLFRETTEQIGLVDAMLTKYEIEKDPEVRRRMLAGTAVIGAYIKRFGNLLLTCERSDTADSGDLTRCFEESFLNLELLNVDCLCTLPAGLTMQTKDMRHIYRTFESILEDCMFELHQIWIKGSEKEGQILVKIELVCDKDLSDHAWKTDDFQVDAETTCFSFLSEKGGA